MSEANAAGGVRAGIRPLMAGGMPARPGPYDRGDRFGMGGMGMGGMGYGRGRNRNLKGIFYFPNVFVCSLKFHDTFFLMIKCHVGDAVGPTFLKINKNFDFRSL